MRNFGHRKIVPADEFSPYEWQEVRWPVYLIVAVTLGLVGIGVFIA